MKTRYAIKGALMIISFLVIGLDSVQAYKDEDLRFDSDRMNYVLPVDDKIENHTDFQKEEPVLHFKGDLLYVSYINLEGKTVQCNFIDRFYNTIIFKYCCSDKIYQKAFDIKKLEKGEYIFIIRIDREVYKYKLIRG